MYFSCYKLSDSLLIKRISSYFVFVVDKLLEYIYKYNLAGNLINTLFFPYVKAV